MAPVAGAKPAVGAGGQTGARWLAPAALATVYVVWGSTYLGIKVGLEAFPPFLLAAVRFGVAGAALHWWVRRRGLVARRPLTVRQWRTAAVAGGLLLVGGNGAVTWAEQHIDSGIAALLVATVPLWMALIDRVVFGQRLRPAAVVGLVLGFAGVGLLVGPSTQGGAGLVGAAVVLLGALLWASGSLYSRGADLPSAPLVSVSMQMLSAAAMFALLSFAGGELAAFDATAVTWRAAGAVAYLALFGSVVAFTAYSWLLKNVPAATVATYAYVNPVVAVVLGSALLGEPLSATTVVAAAVIVTSVALIAAARRGPAAARRVRAPVTPVSRGAVGAPSVAGRGR